MKAFQLVQWQQPPELREVPVPEPGPGQVLVKVGAAGACHSDLHLMEWPEGLLPFDVPFTLGHETAGWVEAVGAGVTGWQHGDPVLVYGPWGCGGCPPCRESAENYCERAAELRAGGGGLGRDGGMAEYMLVPSARHLVALGDLDPVEAAPLTDAALTPYHAIKRSMPKLVPGSTAVVIGVGGLGHMAIQILRATTAARIVAVDVNDDKVRHALEVGADHAFLAADNATAQVRALTGDVGAEVILDCVGNDASIALGASLARVRSDLDIVGLALGTYPFGFPTVPYECSLTTSYWGSARELTEVVALAQAGRLRATVECFPLERVAEAYERLHQGSIEGRAVIVPGS